jgi:hypothetical protein
VGQGGGKVGNVDTQGLMVHKDNGFPGHQLIKT